MSGKKKQAVRVRIVSPVTTVGTESNAISSTTEIQSEKVVTKSKRPVPIFPTLLPYTPPDSLMFPLFSAIQRRAWVRARKLCYELILCDPIRKNYRDLYYQIDHIITLIEHRRHPKAVINKLLNVDKEKHSSSGSSSSSSDDEE